MGAILIVGKLSLWHDQPQVCFFGGGLILLDQTKTSWIAALQRRCFPLTYGCGLGAEESSGERRSARLHTTVGCSHGDERRK